MKKSLLIIIAFILGAITAHSQAYVSFAEAPKMQLTAQNQYSNYKIKYRAVKKSTIYLELKKGNLIVASGILDVPQASEKISSMTIKVKASQMLIPGQNYSYNLYMYSGGRNDWTNKACKSVSINGVQMENQRNSKKNNKSLMSLRNFFD